MKHTLENGHYETVHHSTINHMSFFIMDINFRSAHAHTDIEILQIIKGSMHISTKGSEFDLKPGEMALLNANEVHMCYSNNTSPCCTLVLQINPAFCQSYFPGISYIRFLTNNISVVIPPKHMEDMKRTCFNIGYNFFGQKVGFEFRCISDVNRLFSYLQIFVPYETFSDQDYLSQQHTQHRMQRILEHIQKHYCEKLTLKEIADRENVSVTYLSSFFKKNMHQSFQSYLNNLRFEHALYLIQKTDKKIIDICIESGFSDSKYLNKMFMDVYHITPNNFRKQILAGNIPVSTIDTARSTSQYKYTISESLQILRKYHHFQCDNGSFVNYID